MYIDYVNAGAVVTDVSAINNSIKNILLTKKGSVPGKPRFGSDIYKIVFEMMDPITEDMLKQYTLAALREFEPRITINYVKITSIPEYNKIIADINYSYRDSGLLQSTTTQLNLSV